MPRPINSLKRFQVRSHEIDVLESVFIFVDSVAVDNLDFSDEIEWDTKTLASAVKGYFA